MWWRTHALDGCHMAHTGQKWKVHYYYLTKTPFAWITSVCVCVIGPFTNVDSCPTKCPIKKEQKAEENKIKTVKRFATRFVATPKCGMDTDKDRWTDKVFRFSFYLKNKHFEERRKSPTQFHLERQAKTRCRKGEYTFSLSLFVIFSWFNTLSSSGETVTVPGNKNPPFFPFSSLNNFRLPSFFLCVRMWQNTVHRKANDKPIGRLSRKATSSMYANLLSITTTPYKAIRKKKRCWSRSQQNSTGINTWKEGCIYLYSLLRKIRKSSVEWRPNFLSLSTPFKQIIKSEGGPALPSYRSIVV